MKRTNTFQKIKSYKEKHPFVFYFMILYLGGILIYILIFHLWFADYSSSMSLNELGDFLAGIFSPLAFLFLYLGYKQNSEAIQLQSNELQISNASFKKQCEELANSVEQQRQLVEATTEDLKFSKAQYQDNSYKELVKSQPFFHLSALSSVLARENQIGAVPWAINKLELNMTYSNSRALAREVTLEITHQGKTIDRKHWQIFKGDGFREDVTIRFDLSSIFKESNQHNIDIKISYLDEIDRPQFQKYQIEIHENRLEHDQRTKVIKGKSSF